MNLPTDYRKLNWKQRKAAREEYIKLQNNKCFYCGEDLDKDPPESITNKEIHKDLFPPNFFKYPIHLQHDHVTGMTEGAVHSYCNAVMWEYEHK